MQRWKDANPADARQRDAQKLEFEGRLQVLDTRLKLLSADIKNLVASKCISNIYPLPFSKKLDKVGGYNYNISSIGSYVKLDSIGKVNPDAPNIFEEVEIFSLFGSSAADKS